MKKIHPTHAAIISVALFFRPTPVLGQDARAPDSGAPAARELEEIIVHMEVSLMVLRAEMEQAIDGYFDTFNELNSTDEFDIHCSRERLTGTRMMQRQCRARFYSDLEAEAARQWRDFGGPPPQQWLASQQALILQKAALLSEEMKRLALEHPELLSALIEADDAQERFRIEKERRCEGRLLLCAK